jgi:hypothetical protein
MSSISIHLCILQVRLHAINCQPDKSAFVYVTYIVFRGRIFSHVRPFYERAVSDLDPKRSMHGPV